MNLLLSIFCLMIQPFYQLSYQAINGTNQSCTVYAGKKILLVNIALNGEYANQLPLLESLYQQHSGNLKIIAFPSDSFGNSPEANEVIDSVCRQQFQITFDIASKSPVVGDSANTIYRWLHSRTLNGRISGTVASDFHKFLMDESGQIIGQFSPTVSPLDTLLINAIINN